MRTLNIVLLIFSQIYLIAANLIGIDLGTEYFKITIIKPGRPFTMVENLQSKTKTPLSINFKDEDRFFGVDAIGKRARFPKQTFVFMHEFLGKQYGDQSVNSFIEQFFVPYDIEETEQSKTYSFKVNFQKEEYKFSTEEIFGMIFRHIKYLVDKFAGNDIRDCVVTVPAFFGYKERQAIVQAVELSKLNLLGLVSENVAAAVQFSLDKKFNETEYYIFYNMGSSNTQASLVAFKTIFEEKNNKTVEVGKQVIVLDEAWEKNLGGNAFNYKIIRHLMEKFDQSPGREGMPSVKSDYRVAERLVASANKLKEVLSANKEAVMNILGVDSGMNLNAKISRDEFESMSSDLLERVYTPIEKLLNRTGIDIAEIKQVELLGGSVRIPKLQELLKEKLGNIVGTHMNGDDSMALGAAFISANYSSNFRKDKKFELYHGANYEIKLDVVNHDGVEEYCPENFTDFAIDCVRKIEKNTTLLKIRHGFGLDRKVSFRHDSDVVVHLYENFEDSEPKRLFTYKITGVKEVLKMMKNDGVTDLPKLNLRFNIDNKGLITFKADASYEIILYLQFQKGPTGGLEFVYTPNYTEPIPPEQIEEELAKVDDSQKAFISMQKDVGKKRVQDNKKNLTVELIEYEPYALTKEQIQASIEKINNLDTLDDQRITKMQKRNDLETLIYNKKEWLDSKEATIYGKESELEKAKNTLSEIYNWFEDEAFSSDITTLDSKLSTLRIDFGDMDLRIAKHKKRQKAEENFGDVLVKSVSEAEKLVNEKPWVEQNFYDKFMKEVEAVRAWFGELKEKQEATPLNEDPVYSFEQVESKLNIIKREFYNLSKIQKPKQETDDNLKVEDLLKNGKFENIEELLKKYNATAFNKTETNKSEDKAESTEPSEKAEEDTESDNKTEENDSQTDSENQVEETHPETNDNDEL